MGSDRKVGTRLIARCCYGASFGFGFVVTVLTFSAMFWIAWCYFGLTIVHISDTQRRAIVNYSFTTTKPSTTTATPLLNRTTTLSMDETSINSISKSSTVTSTLRGSSRDTATSVVSPPRGPPRRIEDEDDSREKAPILNASSERSEDDQIYARRVLPPGSENRPEDKNDKIHRKPSDSDADSRPNISPTKVYDVEPKYSSSRGPEESGVDRIPRDDARSQPRDYEERSKSIPPRRDDIQSSRRSDSEPAYREPDFDREYPRRRPLNTERETSRYDDADDDRGSRSRYDRRDRGRDTDDRYSKGDTRVYPDDGKALTRAVADDRYKDDAKDRYPETRRGDDDKYDDRYRDYDDRYRYRDRDRDDKKYRDRDLDDRSPLRDERPRNDERYRSIDDDRYRSRDDKYRDRDEDRYRSRDDDKYRSRDDDRYRSRDDDRYRYEDDERYRSRDEDRYRAKDDDKQGSKDDDQYRREPERVRDSGSRYRDETDKYRPKLGEERYVDTSPTRPRDSNYREPVPETRRDYAPEDRKFNSRTEYASRDAVVSDYDIEKRDRSRPYVRESVDSSRETRPLYDEDRYRDRNRDSERPPRSSEDNDRRISPSRPRDEASYSRSSLVDSRPKEITDDSRYADTQKEGRVRDDKYDQNDRIFSSRRQDSRSSLPASESSRRVADDREEYRTRLPNENSGGTKFTDRREEVVLDRRSYASEEDDEYRRRNTRRDYDYDERSRRPSGDTRRSGDDERYIRRDPADDDEYKRSRSREPYDEDRLKRRDRYDDDYRRYDDKYVSRDQDRYISRDDLSSSRKYDTSYAADDVERNRRRNPEPSDMRKEDYDERSERRRSSSSSRSKDERPYPRDEYPDSRPSSRRRDDDDLSLADSRSSKDSYPDDRRRGEAPRQDTRPREPAIGSSMSPVYSREPSDVVIREKRYQSSNSRRHTSRVSTADDIYSNQNNKDLGSKPQEVPGRPLTAKDVIEAAIKQSDASDQNARKVYYPVFDPRVSNLTSPEIIRPSERRGTTITAKKKRSI